MTLQLSLPEVDALCVRAGRGAGMTWGMAEECGQAAVWLARYGFDWADLILRCFQEDRGAEIVPAVGLWQSTGPVCGLRIGVAFSDFALLPEGPLKGSVVLGNVFRPELLLPGLMRTAVLTGCGLEVRCDNVVWAHVAEDAVHLSETADQTGEFTVIPTNVVPKSCVLRSTSNAATPITSAQKTSLDDFALRMAVPTSAQSHAGAGAEGPETD